MKPSVVGAGLVPARMKSQFYDPGDHKGRPYQGIS